MLRNKALYYDPFNKTYEPFRLLVLGHGGHGKDAFTERLVELTGVTHTSSSMMVCETIIMPWFNEYLPTMYDDVDACFNDRRQWRGLWYRLISDYNSDDKTQLARDIMTANDVYVGMRCADELQACIDAGIFSHIVWVDAGDRVEREHTSSCTVEFNPDIMCMVDNSGAEEDLNVEVSEFVSSLGITG